MGDSTTLLQWLQKKYILKYEIGVNWSNGFICWIGGPIQGKYHDVTLSRKYGILANQSILNKGELCWADKGYIGEDLFITPVKNPSNESQKSMESFCSFS